MKCNNLSCEHLNQFGYCEMTGCTRKKMRLIDGNEIIKIVREEVKDEDNTLPVSFRAGVDYVLKIIIDEVALEVEAIPIKWIVGWLTKQTIPATHTCDDYDAVEMMLEDWEKENETN